MHDRTAELVVNSLNVVPVSQSQSRVELSAEPVRTRVLSPGDRGHRGRRQGNNNTGETNTNIREKVNQWRALTAIDTKIYLMLRKTVYKVLTPSIKTPI